MLSAFKDIGLAVNTGKTKCIEVRRHRGMQANEHNSNCYETVKTYKSLGSLLLHENSVHEEIKCTHKAGNSYYYSVQTFLSSRPFKEYGTEIYIKQEYCQLCYMVVKQGLLH